MKAFVRLLVVMLALMVMVACANNDAGGDGNEQPEQNNVAEPDDGDGNDGYVEGGQEDVTLTLAYPFSIAEERFIEPIEEEFPHITLEIMEEHLDNRTMIEELTSAQNLPDMAYLGAHGNTTPGFEIGLFHDLTQLIEERNFDLNRFEDSLVEDLRFRTTEFEEEGVTKLGALPHQRSLHALHYNKELFDRFGVSYPEDHSTWDEILDLAADLSREEGGIQYHGLHTHFHSIHTQHGINYQNENGEPNFLEEPAFQKTLEVFDRLFSIPGNYPEHPNELPGRFGDGLAAMQAGGDASRNLYENGTVDFDITTYPVYEDNPGVGPFADGAVITILETSEKKEIAFDVIEFLYSEEYQKMVSSMGLASPLDEPDIHAVYGDDLEGYQEAVNIDALFELSPAHTAEGRYAQDISLESLADNPWDAFVAHEYYDFEGDDGLFLQEMQERAEVALEEARARQ